MPEVVLPVGIIMPTPATMICEPRRAEVRAFYQCKKFIMQYFTTPIEATLFICRQVQL